MYPTIKSGDEICILPIDDKIGENEIIVYYLKENEDINLVTHRVIKNYDDNLFH